MAADSKYAQHAAVAMVSVLTHTANPAAVQFYLIADELSDADKAKLTATVTKFHSQLVFASIKDDSLKNSYTSGNLTRAAYFRLDIPNVLPSEVQKVIYLDCDLLVLADVAELWQLDIGAAPLAATVDFGILVSARKRAEKTSSFGWQPADSYFNSGVLILNLAKWREYGYAKKVLELVATKKYRHHDQDALNDIFKGQWYKLPLRWNVIPPVFNMTLRVVVRDEFRHAAVEALKNIAIIHYAGGYKPWEYQKYEGFNDEYYTCLAQSAYKDAPMPQPGPDEKRHSISRQMWRLKWAHFCEYLANL